MDERLNKLNLTKVESLNITKKLMNYYEPFKIAQRVLAFMLISAFLLVHFVTSIIHIVFVIKHIDTQDLIEIYNHNNDTLGIIIIIVVSFYFGSGAVESVVQKVKSLKK